jgi:hypothetical protein
MMCIIMLLKSEFCLFYLMKFVFGEIPFKYQPQISLINCKDCWEFCAALWSIHFPGYLTETDVRKILVFIVIGSAYI